MIYQIKNIACEIQEGKVTKIGKGVKATELIGENEVEREVIPIVAILPLLSPVINLISQIVNAATNAGKYKKIVKLTETDAFKKLSKEQKWDVMESLL